MCMPLTAKPNYARLPIKLLTRQVLDALASFVGDVALDIAADSVWDQFERGGDDCEDRERSLDNGGGRWPSPPATARLLLPSAQDLLLAHHPG